MLMEYIDTPFVGDIGSRQRVRENGKQDLRYFIG